jgi:hypothetical protein
MTPEEVKALIDAATAETNARLDGIVTQLSDINARLDALPAPVDLTGINSSIDRIEADLAMLNDRPASVYAEDIDPNSEAGVQARWIADVLNKWFVGDRPKPVPVPMNVGGN